MGIGTKKDAVVQKLLLQIDVHCRPVSNVVILSLYVSLYFSSPGGAATDSMRMTGGRARMHPVGRLGVADRMAD